MIWVIDASVAVRWFLEDETDANAEAVLRKVVEEPRLFAVPELFSFEVYAVLQRLHPEGFKAFRKGIIPILQGGILRHPMTERLAKRADKFVRKGLTGYDACYAALAEDLKGLWLTFDKRAHQRIGDNSISHLIAETMPPGWE
ncbi:MAG: type II toxin-antitoxin system VapC family toxin [Deltaproteobacteria bacterium]|nr:type II toxin-antitoxin system VapC family toxin [Deltaproteobacteria bacterium]MBW1930457.1 type II toxin-antitoxin system VapC family toxin [Deltaproteobacteria bacterium]